MNRSSWEGAASMTDPYALDLSGMDLADLEQAAETCTGCASPHRGRAVAVGSVHSMTSPVRVGFRNHPAGKVG